MSPLARAGWFAGKAPDDIGVRDGRLQPCPDSPNCVGSQSAGAARIAPIALREPASFAWQRLSKIVAGLPRMRIVERTDRYLRLEASSRIFGFVDDVEFLLDPDANVIHVRSASRLGYSDLGVNRDRVEHIRRLLDSDPGSVP